MKGITSLTVLVISQLCSAQIADLVWVKQLKGITSTNGSVLGAYGETTIQIALGIALPELFVSG